MGRPARGIKTINIAAVGLLALAVIYGASAFKEQEPEAAAAEPAAGQQAVSARQIIEEAEEKRRLELDKKREEAILEAKRLKKEQSPECKFWTLQKQKGTSAKADEKIAQYCVM